MVISESIRTSLEEVKGHPLRSFFTLIGVILGTLALVVVMSVLDGVQMAVWEGIEDLGFDNVLVLSQKKPTDPFEQKKAHLSPGMRAEDTEWFEGAENIRSVAPVGETRAVITAGTFTRRVNVYGVSPEFASIK